MKHLAIALLAALAGLAHAADKPAPKAPPAKAPTAPVSAAPAMPAVELLEACDRLEAHIEASEREIAWIKASGIVDNSAPRETTRLLAKLSEQQKQSQSLTMMVALKCPTMPIDRMRDGNRYLVYALECRNVDSKDKEKFKEACTRAKWTPQPLPDDPMPK